MKIQDIPWSEVVRIGAGGYATVFVFGEYAVKVGEIRRGQFTHQKRAAELGLAPPVYAYRASAEVPEGIRRQLGADHFRQGGAVDVLLMARAVPVIRCTEDYSNSNAEMDAGYAAVTEFRAKVEAAGSYWADPHPGNVCRYNGVLMGLDWD